MAKVNSSTGTYAPPVDSLALCCYAVCNKIRLLDLDLALDCSVVITDLASSSTLRLGWCQATTVARL